MKFKSFRSIRTGIAGLLAATALFSCLTSAGAATFSLSGGGFSLSASPTANLTPTSASGVIVPNGVYYLALHDDRSLGLNVIFASTQADAATIGVDPLNGEHNESFRIVNRGGGYISLHPLHAESLALNALLGANCEKGSLLTLHAYADGDDASLFYPVKQSDGSYVLRSKACGYVIDVANGSYETGNKAILWEANSYARAQSFFLDSAASSGGSGGSSDSSELRQKVSSSSLSTGYYVFGAYGDPDMVANVTFASIQEDKATCGLSPWDAESNEIWYVERVGSGNYVTIAPSYCKSLVLNCLLGSGAKAGQGVTLHRKQTGDTASWWLPVLNRDSSYTFVNAASGLALDLANGDCQTVGNGILVYTRNNFLPAQGWHVYKVNDPKAAQRDPEYLNISSGGSASSAEAAILARLNAMIDGSYGNGAYKVNTTYTGAFANEQCKGFAKKVHMILFGYNIGSTKAKPNNYQISISTSKTRLVGSLTSLSSRSDAALQALLTQARPGDFLQVRRSHGGSHSMIVLSANSSGITVYECNVDGANGIRTATYSWASFRSANAAVSLYTAKDYSLH